MVRGPVMRQVVDYLNNDKLNHPRKIMKNTSSIHDTFEIDKD